MKTSIVFTACLAVAAAVAILPKRHRDLREEMFQAYQRLEFDANTNIRTQTGSDLWGTPLRFTKTTYQSAGPDCVFGTWDDIRGVYNPERISEDARDAMYNPSR